MEDHHGWRMCWGAKRMQGMTNRELADTVQCSKVKYSGPTGEAAGTRWRSKLYGARASAGAEDGPWSSWWQNGRAGFGMSVPTQKGLVQAVGQLDEQPGGAAGCSTRPILG